MKRVLMSILVIVALAGNGAWAVGYRSWVGEEPDRIPVVVVAGTPHDMGVALGTLMKKEISAFTPKYMEAVQGRGGEHLHKGNRHLFLLPSR